MNTKDVIRTVRADRAEAYLRLRYAFLYADRNWTRSAVEIPAPAVVLEVLETVCIDCIERAITGGDWSTIDEILLGNPAPRTSSHIH